MVLKCLLLLLLIFPCVACGEVTVGPGKDYQSFTQAVYETYDSGDTIVVYPGEYDIRQEYDEYFGASAYARTLGHGFERGIRVHDREILFLPGAKLQCVWYESGWSFSPLYVMNGVTLTGLDLYAEGTLYAIHDDVWRCDHPYVNEYRYCRVIGKYLSNANCIGGGVTQNTRIIIDNCYFDNGVRESMTVRYHNTDLPDAVGQIWISNSYFNGYLAMCNFGESSHMDVYVNGCRAEKIYVKPEMPGIDVQHIDLYKWNNDET